LPKFLVGEGYEGDVRPAAHEDQTSFVLPLVADL